MTRTRSNGWRARAVAVAVLAVVTVASFAWVLVQVDLAAMGEALWAAEVAGVAGACAALLVTLVVRTWRFQVLLQAPVGFGPMLAVMSLGSLAMTVIPLRMGELVRPWLLADRHGVPVGESLGAVVVERLLDLLGLLGLLWVVFATVDVQGRVVVGGVDVLRAGFFAAQTASAVGAVGVLGLVLGGPVLLPRLAEGADRLSPALGELVRSQGEALVGAMRGVAGAPVRLVGAVVLTVTTWAVTVGMTWFALDAFAGAVPSWDLASSAWAACSTAMTLFPSPGFLGPFEAAGVAALVAQGVDASVAGAAILTLHAVLLGGYAVTGAVAAAAEGVGLGEAVRRSRGDLPDEVG